MGNVLEQFLRNSDSSYICKIPPNILFTSAGGASVSLVTAFSNSKAQFCCLFPMLKKKQNARTLLALTKARKNEWLVALNRSNFFACQYLGVIMHNYS